MSMKAIANVYSIQTGWAPIAVTATKTSSAIDLANAIENVIVGTFGLWTDGTHTLSLTHSGVAGGAGTYTAVPADQIVGSFAAVSSTATATAPQKVSYIGPYRYLKAVQTVAGATVGAISGVQAILKLHKQNAST